MSNKCHGCGRRPTACQCYAALSLRSDNLVGQPFDFRMGLTGRREHREAVMVTASAPSLPDDATKRLEYPMADGLLDYFPNALAEVSRLSHAATKQHHPDKPMHWDRSKSTDHRNKIMRHLVDAGKLDDKGMRHSAMVAWRALALLQEELEQAEGFPPSRASRNFGVTVQ